MENFLNRKEVPLPKEGCIMEIVTTEGNRTCMWYPFNPGNYVASNMPSEGYLGTARTIDTDVHIGYHAWEQNDAEFLYYKLI